MNKTNCIIISMAILFGLVLSCSKSEVEEYPTEGNITFSDAVAHAIMVQNFDLNNDAELSYKEAAVVTSLTFGGKSGISLSGVETLNELKFFVGVTSFSVVSSEPGVGYSYSFKQISIPKNVNYIGSFCSNSAVEKITCYPLNPPSGIEKVIANRNLYLYVPKESLDLYKERIKDKGASYVGSGLADAFLERIIGF